MQRPIEFVTAGYVMDKIGSTVFRYIFQFFQSFLWARLCGQAAHHHPTSPQFTGDRPGIDTIYAGDIIVR